MSSTKRSMMSVLEDRGVSLVSGEMPSSISAGATKSFILRRGSSPSVSSPALRRRYTDTSVNLRAAASSAASFDFSPQKSLTDDTPDRDGYSTIHEAFQHLKTTAMTLTAKNDGHSSSHIDQPLSATLLQPFITRALHVGPSELRRLMLGVGGASSSPAVEPRDPWSDVQPHAHKVAEALVLQYFAGSLAQEDRSPCEWSHDGNAVVDWDSGTITRRWPVRANGRDYIKSLRALSVARHELLLPEWIVVPFALCVVWKSVLYTVTWVPPLKRLDVIHEAQQRIHRSGEDGGSSSSNESFLGALTEMMAFYFPCCCDATTMEGDRTHCAGRWEYFSGADDCLHVIPTVELIAKSLAGRRIEYLTVDAERRRRRTPSPQRRRSTGGDGAGNVHSSIRSLVEHPQGIAIRERLLPLMVQHMEAIALRATRLSAGGSAASVNWISDIFHRCGVRMRSLLMVRLLLHQQHVGRSAGMHSTADDDVWPVMDSLLMSEVLARALKAVIFKRCRPASSSAAGRKPIDVGAVATATLQKVLRQKKCLSAVVAQKFGRCAADLLAATTSSAHGENYPGLLFDEVELDKISLPIVVRHLEHRLGIVFNHEDLTFSAAVSSVTVHHAIGARDSLDEASLLRDEVFLSDEISLFVMDGTHSFMPSGTTVAAHAMSLYYAMVSVHNDLGGAQAALKAALHRGHALVRSALPSTMQHRRMRSSIIETSPPAAVEEDANLPCDSATSGGTNMASCFFSAALVQIADMEEPHVASVPFCRALELILNTSSSVVKRIDIDENASLEAFVNCRLLERFADAVGREEGDDISVRHHQSSVSASLAHYWCLIALRVQRLLLSLSHDSTTPLVAAEHAIHFIGSPHLANGWLHLVDEIMFINEEEEDERDGAYLPPAGYRRIFREALTTFVPTYVPTGRAAGCDLQQSANTTPPQRGAPEVVSRGHQSSIIPPPHAIDAEQDMLQPPIRTGTPQSEACGFGAAPDALQSALATPQLRDDPSAPPSHPSPTTPTASTRPAAPGTPPSEACGFGAGPDALQSALAPPQLRDDSTESPSRAPSPTTSHLSIRTPAGSVHSGEELHRRHDDDEEMIDNDEDICAEMLLIDDELNLHRSAHHDGARLDAALRDQAVHNHQRASEPSSDNTPRHHRTSQLENFALEQNGFADYAEEILVPNHTTLMNDIDTKAGRLVWKMAVGTVVHLPKAASTSSADMQQANVGPVAALLPNPAPAFRIYRAKRRADMETQTAPSAAHRRTKEEGIVNSHEPVDGGDLQSVRPHDDITIASSRRTTTTINDEAPYVNNNRCFVDHGDTDTDGDIASTPMSSRSSLSAVLPCMEPLLAVSEAARSNKPSIVQAKHLLLTTPPPPPACLERVEADQAKRRRRLLLREIADFQHLCHQDRESLHRVSLAEQTRVSLASVPLHDDCHHYVPAATRAGFAKLANKLREACGLWKRDYASCVRSSVASKDARITALRQPIEVSALEKEDRLAASLESWRSQVSLLVLAFWQSSLQVREDVAASAAAAVEALRGCSSDPFAPPLFACADWDSSVVDQGGPTEGVERMVLRSVDLFLNDASKKVDGAEAEAKPLMLPCISIPGSKGACHGNSNTTRLLNHRPHSATAARHLIALTAATCRPDPIDQLDGSLSKPVHRKDAVPVAHTSTTRKVQKSKNRQEPSLLEQFFVLWVELLSMFKDGATEIQAACKRREDLRAVDREMLQLQEGSHRSDITERQALEGRLLLRESITEAGLTLSRERIGNRKRNAICASEFAQRAAMILDDHHCVWTTEFLPSAEASLRSIIESEALASATNIAEQEKASRFRVSSMEELHQRVTTMWRAEGQARVRITWLENDSFSDLLARW